MITMTSGLSPFNWPTLNMCKAAVGFILVPFLSCFCCFFTRPTQPDSFSSHKIQENADHGHSFVSATVAKARAFVGVKCL